MAFGVLLDPKTAADMEPLLKRGRAALTASTPRSFIGGHSLVVVTIADFSAHMKLCLRHVTRNRVVVHLLMDHTIVAAIEPRTTLDTTWDGLDDDEP